MSSLPHISFPLDRSWIPLQIGPIFSADVNPLVPIRPQRKEGQVWLQNSTSAATSHKVCSSHNHYNYYGSTKDHDGFRTDRFKRQVAATFNRYPIKNHYKITQRARWALSPFNHRSYSGTNFHGETEDSKRQQKDKLGVNQISCGSPFVRNPNRMHLQQKPH